MKKITTIVIMVCLVFSLVTNVFYAANNEPKKNVDLEANNSEDASQYTTDWEYWSQGASAYGIYGTSKDNSAMQRSGCRLVAHSKLLVEAGVASGLVDYFNPDIFWEWGNANGFYGIKGKLNGNVVENKFAAGPIAYAKEKGVTISYSNHCVVGLSAADKDKLVMEYLNKGYYIIVGGVAHQAYIGREASLERNSPVIWDSFSNWSYNSTQKRVGLGNGQITYSIDYIYLYAVSGKNAKPQTTEKQAPTITTNAVAVISPTKVKLSGAISNPGNSKITECGIMLRKGSETSRIAGVDYPNRNPKTLTFFYDNISVEENKTYTYYAYAVVDGKPYTGNSVTFTTGSHSHDYNDLGVCKSCGVAFPLKIDQVNKTMITARTNGNDVPCHTSPYGATTITRRLKSKGETVAIKAKTVNAFGNLWYQTTSDDWIVYDYLAEKGIESSLKITATGATQITGTSARLNGTCSYTGMRPSSVGVNFGLTPGTMGELDLENVTHNKNPFDIWYNLSEYGKTLEPGKTYYYQLYATVNENGGSTIYYSDIKNFTTTSAPSPVPQPTQQSTLKITATGATQITSTSARLNGTCSYTGTRPSSVGVNFGSAPGTMSELDLENVTHNKNPFDIWYNLSEYGKTLEPGKTYYYQLYAIVNEKSGSTIYYSDIKNFTTVVAPTPPPQPPQQSTVRITSTGATQITTTNAQLNGTCSYTGTRPSSVGVYFGSAPSTMGRFATDNINHNKNPFDIWYNLKEYGKTLNPGTTYYYQLYAIVDGKETKSEIKSFTTTAPTPVATPITFSGIGVRNLTKTNAEVYCTMTYSGVKPSAVGVRMSGGSLYMGASDIINHSKNPFDAWYNVNKDMYGELKPGITYTYYFYAEINGKEYTSTIRTFTTPK